jgi:multiple sugar transport system substrate-binding protein
VQLKQTRYIKLISINFFGSLILSFSAHALTIGVIHDNASERYNFFEIEQNFRQYYPNIPIKFVGLPSARYKQQVNEWLASGTGPDVLYWFSGVLLKQFVRKGYVANLDGLSKQYNWQKKFSPTTLKTASFQRSLYAIPISYYQWGIFYNKQVLKQFDIQPPVNWQDFLAACNVLKNKKIEPIALGSSEPWLLGAWFDYLNLRLNGLDFHQRLLNGEIPFTDQRVIKLFDYWAELVNKEYFLSGHQGLKWNEAMPYLYRDLSAFTLIGNFLSIRIPTNVEHKIGFIPFPEIVPENAGYEDAPMDVFFIRSSSNNKDDAEKFLAYLSRADVQTSYNKYAGGFPPNKAGKTTDNEFNKAGLQLLQNAKGLSQFFDRDLVDDFSVQALHVLAEFMQKPNIAVTVQKLEQLRQTKLIDTPSP